MGLIRSGQTELTPVSPDKDLTEYLWPIVREMVKTAIENNQNLIVEGCYIPFDWADDFDKEYLDKIKYYCLVFSENYIKKYFDNIQKHACIIEKRLDDQYSLEDAIKDNAQVLKLAKKYTVNYILIDDKYDINVEL